MRRTFIGVVALVVLPLAAQHKEPWRLKLEERIALRTNADLARERVRGSSGDGTRMAANADSDAPLPADTFNGKTHPELFLPHEVFRSLMTHAFLGSARSGELFRKGLRAEIVKRGLPSDFWERLRTLSAVYLADAAAENDLGAGIGQVSSVQRKTAQDALSLKQLDVCRSRADAIVTARREFGDERFNRFLYEVIAVNKFHSERQLPSPDVLRWVETGCR